MSANKPKRKETDRRPEQEEDETYRPHPDQRGEERPEQGKQDKNKKKGG